MFLRPVRTAQPQGPAQIDANNALGKKVLFALTGTHGAVAGGPKSRIGTVNGTVSKRPRTSGQTAAFDGASYLDFGAAPILSAGQPFAIAINEEISVIGAYGAMLGLAIGVHQFLWIRGNASIPYYCALGTANGSTPASFQDVPVPVVGERVRFVVTGKNISDATTYRLWADGVELTRSSASFGTVAASTNKIGWDGADGKWNGLLSDVAIFGELLGDDEVRSYFANPQQIYTPSSRSLWVPGEVGAGGGTSYTLTADSAALTLSGAAASLKASQSLSASSTAISLTGQSATLTHSIGTVGYSLSASSTALTLAGQSATLKTAHKLAASSAAITLAGQSATLTHTLGSAGYGITATSTPITLAGQSATLTTAHKLAASSAAITLAGQSANLAYSSSSATYTLVASTSAITLTGQAAALKVVSRLAADSAAFELATQAAALRTGFVLPAASGDMSLAGQDAVLTTSRRLAAESAALTLVGQAAGLVWSGGSVAVYPAPDKVLLGITYGPTGADYTGTATGGSGPSAAEIAAAVRADLSAELARLMVLPDVQQIMHYTE